MESAEAAAAAHTSLLYGMSKNQNQIITMAKRDKGSYHKEPIRAQSTNREILWRAGFMRIKTTYTKKNPSQKHEDVHTFKFWNVSSLDLFLFSIDIKAVSRYLVLFINV